MSTLRLTFFGGAQTVTGANFLLEGPLHGEGQFRLLVDCGIEQGRDFCEACNTDPFPYAPDSVDVLFVTHAHLDHIGRIPKLVRDGFQGAIYSTPATKEIALLSLLDSVELIAREARDVGREPLYTREDVNAAEKLWKNIPYYTKTEIPNTPLTVYFRDAGHILGSAIITVTYNNKNIVFTGDLGNSPSPLLRDTDVVDDADYLVMESAYGDRNHESPEGREEILRRVVTETLERGGVLMIPAFSIERTQVVLHEIFHLIEEGVITEVPVFLDSPLAINVTKIYERRIKNFNNTIQDEIKGGMPIFNFPKLKQTLTRNESQAIADVHGPKIIIAGSGMSHGGRIIFHEKRYLSDPKNTLLLVGYQAAGSLGRLLQEGVKKVTLLGTKVPVRAQIEVINGFSAHKDSKGLLSFVEGAAGRVQKVFVAMGEPKSSLFLVQRLRDYIGIDAIAPRKGDSFELDF